MRDATPLSQAVDMRTGGHDDRAGADVVIITTGVNEVASGANGRSWPLGEHAVTGHQRKGAPPGDPGRGCQPPLATIIEVTAPPDPLAELARALVGHNQGFSTGTVLDPLRFRAHLGEHSGSRPADVAAIVVGEDGRTEGLLSSSSRVAGVPVLDPPTAQGLPVEQRCQAPALPHEVRA